MFGVFLIPVLYVVIQKMSDRVGKRTDKKSDQPSTIDHGINAEQGV